MSDESSQKLSDYVRLRLVDARKKKGWSQRELAKAMAEVGWPIDRTTIARIESGGVRAENLTLNEVHAFAAVLGMSPLHLIAPWNDDARVSIAPRITSPAKDVRLWMQGVLPLNFDWAANPKGGERAERLGQRGRDRRFFDYMKPAPVGEDDE
jgi:transcriptional regulator with XRE-family HTH domain